MAPTDYATPATHALLSAPVARAVRELFIADNHLSSAILTNPSALLLAELPVETAIKAIRVFVARHLASPLRADPSAACASLQHVCCEFWSDDRQTHKAALVLAARTEDLHRDTQLKLAQLKQPAARKVPNSGEWSPALRIAFDLVFTAGSGLSLADLDRKSLTALRSMSCADAADVVVEFACSYTLRRATVRNVNKYLMGVVRNHMTRKSAQSARQVQAASRSPSPQTSRSASPRSQPRASPSPPGRAPQFLHVPRINVSAPQYMTPSPSPVPTPPLAQANNQYHPLVSVPQFPQVAAPVQPQPALMTTAPAGWMPVPVAGGYVMMPPPQLLAPFAGMSPVAPVMTVPPVAMPMSMPMVGVMPAQPSGVPFAAPAFNAAQSGVRIPAAHA